MLDLLDPHWKYIKNRFYRNQCVQTEDFIYVKDLWMFQNFDMKDVIIVDNAVYSFGF